jgi:hypothetical protein
MDNFLSKATDMQLMQELLARQFRENNRFINIMDNLKLMSET